MLSFSHILSYYSPIIGYTLTGLFILSNIITLVNPISLSASSFQTHIAHFRFQVMTEKYYSTGRGGAGNITHNKDITISPKLGPQGSNTPHINSEKVTTGRGGFGNIIKNDDPELTRKLQDVEDKPIRPTVSSKSFVGRGGYGNIISDDIYTVTSNGKQQQQKPEKKGFFNKIISQFK